MVMIDASLLCGFYFIMGREIARGILGNEGDIMAVFDFRTFYHRFCFVEGDWAKQVMKGMQEDDFPAGCDVFACPGFLAYVYVDHEAGMTLEVLAFGNVENITKSTLIPVPAGVSIKARVPDEMQSGDKVYLLSGPFGEWYAEKVKMVNQEYGGNDKVENFRRSVLPDPYRHPEFPDDIRVSFVPETPGNIEVCWVRGQSLAGYIGTGILLNEPRGNFGVHRGDTVTFAFIEHEGKPYCVYLDGLDGRQAPEIHVTVEVVDR